MCHVVTKLILRVKGFFATLQLKMCDGRPGNRARAGGAAFSGTREPRDVWG